MENLSYPIGKLHRPTKPLEPSERRAMIDTIAETPLKVRDAVHGLTDAQLDTPYRPSGWTVRQVVHHVPDSHMNAYIRLKLGLAEDNPTIKPYDQEKWAQLSDSRTAPIDSSLALLDAVHVPWVRIMRSMTAADFARGLVHPEVGQMTLDGLLATYAWHGAHHTAHITNLRNRMGW